MSLARTERSALADLLAQLGPDKPTLCEGWDTGDLLAHLLVRDRRPDAAAGMFVKPLSGHLDSTMADYRRKPWATQLDLLRAGPPAWNPTGWGKLDELTNSSEFFIHHEDARRGESGWQPRDLDAESTNELTKIIASPAMRLSVRGLPCGVTARLPDGREFVLKKSEPGVVVTGEPGELLLWAFGRDECAVELSGDEATLAVVQAHRAG